MKQEVELKLELMHRPTMSPEATGLFGGPGTVETEAVRQRSIYFDTPDHALFSHGFSLRIRRSAGKRVQTIKARSGASAGLFSRSEWERPVNDDTPVIDETTPLARLLGDAAETIGPIFEVHIDRRSWVVHEASAEIEAVLDTGEARVGDRRIPIHEAELELKSGEASALFDLARKLDGLVPLRIGVLSKAERGYRLLGPALTMFKAEPVMLDTDMTAGEAFQAIARSCLRQFRQNEELLLQRRDAEALHQARVALRRLRSAFTIFKAVLPDAEAEALKQSLRSTAATLGKARNLDVLLGRAEPGPLRTRIEQGRGAAYDAVEAMLASSAMRGLMMDLARWLALGAWLTAPETHAVRDARAESFAAGALGDRMKRVKKRGKHLEGVSDIALHALRKEAKKLRYASEFFAGYYSGKKDRRRHARFVKVLETLQDQLGLLNDLATAPEVLSELGIGDDPGAEALGGKLKRGRLIVRAGKAYDRLVDCSPFWT